MAETTPAVRGGPDRAGPIEMDYWKSYVTLHHVLACELSYSLIYDNIRPDKVWDALATVGLTQLPTGSSSSRWTTTTTPAASYTSPRSSSKRPR